MSASYARAGHRDIICERLQSLKEDVQKEAANNIAWTVSARHVGWMGRHDAIDRLVIESHYARTNLLRMIDCLTFSAAHADCYKLSRVATA